jgi:hypothetical protein
MNEYTESEEKNRKTNTDIKKQDKYDTELDIDFEPGKETKETNEDLESSFEPNDENELTDNEIAEIFTPMDEKGEDQEILKKSINRKNYKKLEKLNRKFLSSSLKEVIENKYRDILNENLDIEGWKLEECEELAELICIGLGDGSIPLNRRHFRVTLNRSQEPQYAMYVYDLMFNLLRRKPSIYEPEEADAIKFTVGTKRVVGSLVKKGLKPGDKKVNQVNVPNWIKKNPKFHYGGLRGLVDTDGSIHIHKQNKSIRLSFKNASLPLVKDFKNLCEENGIHSQKIYPVPNKNTFLLVIESKKDVCKFLSNVQPRKWKYRAKTLGYSLISMKDPQKRLKIENELFNKYPDKKVHYTDECREDLKNWCIKYGYDVSNEAVVKEIEKTLTYRDNYTGIPKERKKQLNIYAEKIIDDLKQRWLEK